MNAAIQKIKRAQVIARLDALVSWRHEITNEIFECAMREQSLRGKRNSLDIAIETGFLELSMLTEKRTKT